jgi:hypothetical protein
LAIVNNRKFSRAVPSDMEMKIALEAPPMLGNVRGLYLLIE